MQHHVVRLALGAGALDEAVGQEGPGRGVVKLAHLALEDHPGLAQRLPNLTADLAVVGGQLLVETLNEGLGTGVPQAGETTYATKVSADELRLDWNISSIEVLRRVRAVRSYTMIGAQRLKILHAEPLHDHVQLDRGQCDGAGVVGTRDGAVRLVTVQPEGKGIMDAASWLRGRSGQEIIQFS